MKEGHTETIPDIKQGKSMPGGAEKYGNAAPKAALRKPEQTVRPGFENSRYTAPAPKESSRQESRMRGRLLNTASMVSDQKADICYP